MKYNEFAKKLKKAGCYDTCEQINSHPKWYSPITDKFLKMSNHGGEEVKRGTLQSILRDAGLK